MSVAIRFHYGRLADMPRCAACGRIAPYCDHPDAVFAGIVPASNSSAVALLPGAGAAGSVSPTRHCRPILVPKSAEPREDFHNDITEPAGFNHGEINGG